MPSVARTTSREHAPNRIPRPFHTWRVRRAISDIVQSCTRSMTFSVSHCIIFCRLLTALDAIQIPFYRVDASICFE